MTGSREEVPMFSVDLLSLYLLLLAASPSARSPEATIATLDAGLQQWRKDVRFRSTFHLRHGYAKSVEAGLRDGVDPSITEPPEGAYKANGVFHQKGDLIRFSLDYSQPPIPVQPAPP